MKKLGLISDGILLVLSAVLCFGTKFLFHACAPKEDGSWMACHWAEQTVFGLGIVLLILSIMTFVFKDGKTKSGMQISMAVISALTLTVPNHLIKLCMMPDMRCHSVMKPAVMIISILLIVFAVISGILHRKEESAS
ncbi:MAG: DUF4418 family protein [Oscillospiraceae bacterium]|nr:DUF4418 family protein [Oscillospiraceae bacterium]